MSRGKSPYFLPNLLNTYMKDDVLEDLKDKILSLDPVHWCEKNLKLDSKPFSLGNGWDPYLQIYRYLAMQALSPDGKPVVFVKSRQVGGTVTATFLELYYAASGNFGKNGRPPIRIVHAFPQLEQAMRYSKTKFDTTVESSRYVPGPKGHKIPYIQSKLTGSTASDSIQFKKFENGNEIHIQSTGLTGDRIRGMSVDVLFCDEVQDMRAAAITNILKCLNQAQYGARNEEHRGVQFYFGTAKKKGSEYHNLWLKSTQQYFHLGCLKCENDFPLYQPESESWEEVWIEDDLDKKDPSHGFMVKCPHCEHVQDKRKAAAKGKWVPYNKDPKAKYIGFHLNQLLVPTATRQSVIAQKPENNPFATTRSYKNEVLGEFYSGGSAPLTIEDLDTHCAIPGKEGRMYGMLTPNSERRVYLGCDWGLKVDLDLDDQDRKQAGQSYSCAVVLVTEGSHVLRVAYAERFKKNSLEYKLERIEELMRRYSVDLALGDIGYGQDVIPALQRAHGDKFMGASGLHRVNGKFSFKDKDFPKIVNFEKDFVLEEVFDKFKRGEFKLPYGHIGQIEWLLEHLTSMEIRTTFDRSGEVLTKYVKGTTPNDGLMALVYAYVAHRFMLTKGFTENHPDRFKDPTIRIKPPLSIGHLKTL